MRLSLNKQVATTRTCQGRYLGAGRVAPLLVPLLVSLGLNAGSTTAVAADSIYWANQCDGTVRVGNLDGSGTASALFSGEHHPARAE